MSKKIFKNVRCTETTHSKISFISDRLNIPISRFLEELTNQLFDIFSSYERGKANCFYDGRGSQLIITVFGKSVLSSGGFPVPTQATEEEVSDRISKEIVKSIKKENEKNV